MIRKKFPIHNNRSMHTIPITNLHSCTPSCKYRAVHSFDDDLNIVVSIVDSDTECPYKDTVTGGLIKLSTFDPTSPSCLNGPLSQPNSLVIRDPHIKLVIDYPLTIPAVIDLHAPSPEGFRLSHLIKTISDSYRDIYLEEEGTATIKTYSISLPCKDCMCSTVTKQDSPPSPDDCPICFNKLESDSCKTSCNHSFHKECILQWSRHGDKCPVCRDPLSTCQTCSGTRITKMEWTGKVIPSQYRIFIPRNTTDGRWGIHTTDFENIILSGLKYSQKDKMLYVIISK